MAEPAKRAFQTCNTFADRSNRIFFFDWNDLLSCFVSEYDIEVRSWWSFLPQLSLYPVESGGAWPGNRYVNSG
jgi:hypothetical protein